MRHRTHRQATSGFICDSFSVGAVSLKRYLHRLDLLCAPFSSNMLASLVSSRLRSPCLASARMNSCGGRARCRWRPCRRIRSRSDTLSCSRHQPPPAKPGPTCRSLEASISASRLANSTGYSRVSRYSCGILAKINCRESLRLGRL